MPAAAMLRTMAQREETDCCLVAMAMFAGRSYEDALLAASRHEPKFSGRRGLYNAQIAATLADLGTPVRYRRRVDLEEDYGIIRLDDHVALLRAGVIVDGDAIWWDVADWLMHRGYARDQRVPGVFLAIEG